MPGKWRVGAVIAAVSTLGMIGAFGASAASPTFQPAQAQCERDGGIFVEGGFAYRCQFSGPTAYHVTGAQALCEHAYGGFFLGEDDNYLCLLP
jgi:hypothetical protein